jgi:hypothetical protein
MNERDMEAPITRRELHESLDTWAGAIRAEIREAFTELRALILTVEERLIHRMDSLLDPHRSIPERVGKLEEQELPARVRKLESKVFAPKRRASKRTRR